MPVDVPLHRPIILALYVHSSEIQLKFTSSFFISQYRIEMTYSEEDTLATLKMRALEESDLGTYR